MNALALLLLAAAPSTLDTRSDEVIDLFVRVCLQGEARFRKGEVETVGSTSLPWQMGAFNRPGQYYRVRKPVEAWIAVSDGGTDDRYSRICSVSAKYVDVRAGADRIRAWLREPALPGKLALSRYEESYLDGGAKFEISRPWYSDIGALRSYVLTPEAADRKRRKLEQ
jgi:hypothetical protein